MFTKRPKLLFAVILAFVGMHGGISVGNAQEPGPYVRPMQDTPLFSAGRLTLDHDQRSEIAHKMVRLAGEYGMRHGINHPLRTRLLGLALNLQPGKRSAITLSGQLALPGWEPPPHEPQTGFFDDAIKSFRDWVAIIQGGHGPNPADLTFAAYLEDLVTQIEEARDNPRRWAAEFEMDWSPIVAHDAYPEPRIPTDEEMEDDPAIADASDDDPFTDEPPTVDEPAEPIDLGQSFAQSSTTVPTLRLSQGNPALLQRGEVEVRTSRTRPGRGVEEPEIVRLDANHRLDFNYSGHDLGRAFRRFDDLNTYWSERYQNLPVGHTLMVRISDYSRDNGTSAALAVGVAAEVMLRNAELDPNTAFVGAMDDDGTLRPHSQIEGILRGRMKDYPETLIVPRGMEDAVVPYAEAGRIDALLNMQVLSADNLWEAIELAGPNRPDNVVKAMQLFADIQGLRMTPIELITNAHVQNRLRDIVTLCPNHVSAQVLLRAGQRLPSGNIDLDYSRVLLARHFELLQELAELDAQSITKEVTRTLFPPLRDQLRELRPVLHTDALRAILAINSVADAFEELSEAVERRNESNIRRRYLEMQDALRSAAENF